MSQPARSHSPNAPAGNGPWGLAPRDSEAATEATATSERTGDVSGRVPSGVSHDEDLTPVIGTPQNRITP